jgi:hypothetical protein
MPPVRAGQDLREAVSAVVRVGANPLGKSPSTVIDPHWASLVQEESALELLLADLLSS